MCLGRIGSVTERWDAGGVPMANVAMDGSSDTVCLMYCPEAASGDDVLVHMGFVVEVLGAERAADAKALRTLAADRGEAG